MGHNLLCRWARGSVIGNVICGVNGIRTYSVDAGIVVRPYHNPSGKWTCPTWKSARGAIGCAGGRTVSAAASGQHTSAACGILDTSQTHTSTGPQGCCDSCATSPLQLHARSAQWQDCTWAACPPPPPRPRHIERALSVGQIHKSRTTAEPRLETIMATITNALSLHPHATARQVHVQWSCIRHCVTIYSTEVQ